MGAVPGLQPGQGHGGAELMPEERTNRRMQKRRPLVGERQDAPEKLLAPRDVQNAFDAFAPVGCTKKLFEDGK